MGKFIDVRDGRVGRWFVGDITITGEYESISQDFSLAMLRSTGTRAAGMARLIVRWVGSRSRPGSRLIGVVTQAPAPM